MIMVGSFAGRVITAEQFANQPISPLHISKQCVSRVSFPAAARCHALGRVPSREALEWEMGDNTAC
ncbi:MAG TPA: hypothetical protein VGO47_10815 [Chlamydiales bacterium]|nr:hypothetical protein [Chlamydiales bacterium]